MSARLTPTEKRTQRNRSKLKKRAGGKLRLSVFRSSKHISAQLIDDAKGVTVAAASSQEKAFAAKNKGSNRDAAAAIGKLIAERAIKQGAKTVVFDRGGYLFHGRVKALAEAARAGGLEF